MFSGPPSPFCVKDVVCMDSFPSFATPTPPPGTGGTETGLWPSLAPSTSCTPCSLSSGCDVGISEASVTLLATCASRPCTLCVPFPAVASFFCCSCRLTAAVSLLSVSLSPSFPFFLPSDNLSTFCSRISSRSRSFFCSSSSTISCLPVPLASCSTLGSPVSFPCSSFSWSCDFATCSTPPFSESSFTSKGIGGSCRLPSFTRPFLSRSVASDLLLMTLSLSFTRFPSSSPCKSCITGCSWSWLSCSTLGVDSDFETGAGVSEVVTLVMCVVVTSCTGVTTRLCVIMTLVLTTIRKRPRHNMNCRGGGDLAYILTRLVLRS